MPSSEKTKKELYVAKSLGQLNTLSELPSKMSSTSAKVLVKTAEKMLKEAEHSERMSDEERAYVLYMKYFNVVSFIKKTADYKKQKEYYDSLLGQKNQLNAITKAEGLSESLKQRYEELEQKAIEEKLSALNNLEKKDTEKDNIEITKDDVKITKDDGLEATTGNETNLAKSVKEETPPSDGSISPTQLYSLMKDDNTQIIIIDIRPSDKFQESHISHKSCINVPADIIPPGTTVTYIAKSLPKDSEALWKQRGNVDHIVFVDLNSTIDKVILATPLKTLKDALFKFDSTVIIKSEPLILQGGYEQWLLCYPMMSTNPTISIPSSSQVLSPMPSLDFDYPNFDQAFLITPTPSSTNDQSPESSLSDLSLPLSSFYPKINGTSHEMTKTRTPTIDRSKKPKVVSQVSWEETLSSVVKKKADSDSAAMSKTVKSIPSEPTAVSESSSSGNVDQGALNKMALDIERDLQRLEHLRKQKQDELEKLEIEHKRILLEDKARIERMKEEERKLSALEEMRKKQQTDVADLFRKKRNLQENIKQEVEKSELDRVHKEDEEKHRREELERMSSEEEEKKRRQEEVNRLRMDRKKKEEDKKREIERLEREAAESTLREAKERVRREEERRLKEQKEAEERARKLQEEQDDEQRRLRNKEKREQEQLEKERQERLLEEQRILEREKQLQIEKEKLATLEEQKRLAAQKEMEEKERLEQERLEKERQEKEIVQREKEEKEKTEKAQAEKAQREAEEKLRLLKEEKQTAKTIPSPNLPTGWEKRLDPNTRRYFYLNHNSGTTQWEPPFVTPGQGQVSSSTFTTRLKDEPSDLSRYGGGLKRSSSSPNIAKLVEEEVREKTVPLPSVDRTKKPTVMQEPVRIVTPVLRRDLNPVYGNVSRGLTGLKNLGNTCYMNSTIQCLNNTSPLITYFLTDDYLHDFNRDVGNQVEVVLDFAVVIKALWSGQYRCITPRDFKVIVGKYQPMFAGYDQQDSQEFLTFLLDGLHEGLNKVKKRPNIPELDTDNVADNVAAELSWKNHKLMNESIIVELFQGQLKSTLMCLTCKKKSVTFQAFMYLSLPIPTSSRCTLQDCLKKFLQEEKMSGNSRWRCPKCRVERDSIKKIDIWKLPRILLIGLNRFVYDGPWRQKISTYVDFPVRGLDLATFTNGPSSRKQYKLYGISNHYGTMDGGHYTAFCRNPCTQKWYKFDDHEVYDMSESDVKTSAAFVLYYTSIELTPPDFRQPF